METPPPSQALPRSPMPLLTVALGLTAAVLLWLGFRTVVQELETLETSRHRNEDQALLGSMLHQHEILRMGATLAEKTGLARWHDAYAAAKTRYQADAEALRTLPTHADDASLAMTGLDRQFLFVEEAGALSSKSPEAQLDWAYQARADAHESLLAGRLERIENELESQLESLRWRILFMDQVLTLSCWAAVVTGDRRWALRYRQYEKRLGEALERARENAPDDGATGAEVTEAANVALVELEHRALALMEKGARAEAQSVLESDRYQSLKKLYLEGMLTLAEKLKERAEYRLRSVRLRAAAILFAVLLGIVIVSLVWLYSLRAIRLWRESTMQQRQIELENAVLRALEYEQRRLGRDLHDGLGQHLVGVSFFVRSISRRLEEAKLHTFSEHVAEVSQLVSDALQQTRDLAKGLSPLDLDEIGVCAALAEMAKWTQNRFDVACTVHLDEQADAWGEQVGIQIFRIAQEAVNNALRHGRASSVTITLEVDAAQGTIRLQIADDGLGFKPEEVHNGMGLQNMSYRARLLGGALTVSPRAEGDAQHPGTVVDCVLCPPAIGARNDASGVQQPAALTPAAPAAASSFSTSAEFQGEPASSGGGDAPSPKTTIS